MSCQELKAVLSVACDMANPLWSDRLSAIYGHRQLEMVKELDGSFAPLRIIERNL